MRFYFAHLFKSKLPLRMSKKIFVTGFLLAAFAVMIGAFASHGLKSQIETGKINLQMIQSFETGVRYHMYHAFAIIICGIIGTLFGNTKTIKIASILFISGIILFSGSLYLLSTKDVLGLTHWKWLGPLTPIGGICFILAWVLLIISVLKKNKLSP